MVKEEKQKRSPYFKSMFSLKFTNNTVEEIYIKNTYDILTRRAMGSLIALTIFQIVNVILNNYILQLYIDKGETNDKHHASEVEIFFSYIILGYIFLTILIGYLGKNKYTVIKITHCSSYLCLSLTCSSLKALLTIWDHDQQLFSTRIEMILKILYIIVIDFDYISILVASCFAIALLWIQGYSLGGDNCNSSELIFATITDLLIVVFAYIVNHNIKLLFYYRWKITAKNTWLKSTLDNIQNGLIVLDKYNLHYCNSYVQKKLGFLLEKLKESDTNLRIKNKRLSTTHQIPSLHKKSNDSAGSNIKYSNTYYTKPMKTKTINDNIYEINSDLSELYLNDQILTNLENVNPDLCSRVTDAISSKSEYNVGLSFVDILRIIEIDNRRHESFADFTYLGVKKYETISLNEETNGVVILEIFIRLVENDNNRTVFEFLLKDVSRSKVIEETKAQIKYKTMFLAKLAHEFKNPLIGISELVEDVVETLIETTNNNVNHNSPNHNFVKSISATSLCQPERQKIMQNLSFAKNLSAYMLLLVKDFEVISKTENSSKITVSKSNFSLREEMAFLQQIVQTLISKAYGMNIKPPVSFKMKIDQNVPDNIMSDRMRLSQILINLLSNSIKFTQCGEILLHVQLKHNDLKFWVSDTGKGISESQVARLFKTFNKGEETNNEYGSGLGLSIVKDLCNALGSDIYHDHNIPHGCIFYFYLCKDEKKIAASSNSLHRETVLSNNSSRFSNANQNIDNKLSLATTVNDDCSYSPILFQKIENLGLINNIYDTQYSDYSINSVINNGGCCRSNPLKLIFINNNNEGYNSNESCESAIRYVDKRNNHIADNEDRSPYETNCDSHQKDHHFVRENLDLQTVKHKFNVDFKEISNIIQRKKQEENLVSKNSFGYKMSAIFEFSYLSTLSKTFLSHNDELSVIKKSFKSTNNEAKNRKLCILVADDEGLIRKSIIRVIEKYINSLLNNYNVELTIIEVNDGIESIYSIYRAIKQDIQIDLLISDETMRYFSGSFSVEILSRLVTNNIIPRIPICILTAFEQSDETKKKYNPALVNHVFSKPLSIKNFEEVIKALKIL